MARVAFLGLGAMGARMAARLLAAGHDLTVWNRSPGAASHLVEKGAKLAPTPRQAAAGAEAVIAMVTDDEAARSVWLDRDDGAAHALAPDALAIECSTVTPGLIADLALAARRGRRLLDAPVVGSRPQAEAGQLVFLVGGEEDALAAATPVLLAMGTSVHHIGASGHGSALKLAVNALFAAQLAAAAELIGYLAKAGIAPERAVKIIASLPVASPALVGAARMMAAGDSRPLFTIELLLKDLCYLTHEADVRAAGLTVTPAARAAFEAARAAGLGCENVSGLAKLYW